MEENDDGEEEEVLEDGATVKFGSAKPCAQSVFDGHVVASHLWVSWGWRVVDVCLEQSYGNAHVK